MPKFEVPAAHAPVYRDALGFVMAMSGGAPLEDVQMLIAPYMNQYHATLFCSALARLFFHAVECLVEANPVETTSIELMREMSIQIGIREGGPVDGV